MSVESKISVQDENRASFMTRLSSFSREEKSKIEFAYDIAKSAHRGQTRDGGQRYFEHPRQVALILMDECDIQSADLICGALLHDVLEDSSVFGNPRFHPYKTTKNSEGLITSEEGVVDIARRNIGGAFNNNIAEIVIAVSKPNGQDMANVPKATIHEMYKENLENASAEALLIKMADRLHNLRTLKETTPEKRARKIQETNQDYLPLFENTLQHYPKEGGYLLGEIKKQLEKLQS